MKKLLFVAVAVLMSLAVSVPVSAQEAAKNETDQSSVKKSSKPRSWTERGKGIRVTYISSFKPDSEPEFAILRLAAAEYKEFQENPKDWVNDHHIFKAQVRHLESCSATKPQKDPPGDEPFWYIMLPHYPSSNAMCVSYPAEEGR